MKTDVYHRTGKYIVNDAEVVSYHPTWLLAQEYFIGP